MAKIFNDLVYGQNVNTYAGLPLERAEKVGDQLDTRYRTNKDAQDQLEIMIDNLNVRDVNRPHTQAALENAQNKLTGIREQGTWEHSNLQVRQAAKDFAMDKQVQGSLKDKASYDAYMTDLDTRFKEDKLDPATYQKAKSLAMQQNTKSVEYDSNTGEYSNVWSAYSPMNYQDVQKATFDMGEKWKSSTAPISINYKDKNGDLIESRVKYDPMLKGYKIVGSEELLTETELQSGLRQAVLANPQLRGFVQEGLMFDKALKKDADGNPRGIEVTDLFSEDPASGSLFKFSEERAKEALEKLGFDYDKVMNDPAMREAIYDQLYMNKQVDGYVNPAASAYSYSEIEEKYLTDHVLLESIKHANAMARQKHDWKNKFGLERMKQDFEKEKTKPIIVSNAGAVTAGDKYDATAQRKSITETTGEIAKLDRQIAANKKQGIGNINELINKRNALNTQLKAQEGSYNGKRKSWMKSPDGQNWLEKKYKALEKKYPQGHSLHMSRTEFERHVVKKDLDGNMTVTRDMPGVGRQATKNTAAYRNNYINGLANSFDKEVTTFVRNNGDAGESGDWIGGDKKSYVGQTNTALTTYVDKFRTNFITSDGVQLTDHFNQAIVDAVAGGSKKGDVVATVSILKDDRDGHRYGYTITDKRTGATLSQVKIEPKNQQSANDTYYSVGVQGMKETDPKSTQYKDFNLMAAKADYPTWTNEVFDDQTGNVTDRDDSSIEPEYTDIFTAGQDPNTGQPMQFKIKKGRYEYKDEDDQVLGTNTGWSLLRHDEDPDTGEMIVTGNLPKPGFEAEHNSIAQVIQSKRDPNTGDWLTPRQLTKLRDKKQQLETFSSQNDMKVALWNMQNPNATDDTYYNTSTTTTKVNRESEGSRK